MAAAMVTAAFVVLLTVQLAAQMTVSVWTDEAFIYTQFIDGGLSGALLTDYHTNNHRGFTVLAVVVSSLLGDSDAALRLPSLLPAVVGVCLLSAWLLHSGRAMQAPIVAGLLALSPLLNYWLPQARGYGLALGASALLLVSTGELGSASGQSISVGRLRCRGGGGDDHVSSLRGRLRPRRTRVGNRPLAVVATGPDRWGDCRSRHTAGVRNGRVEQPCGGV